jgi:hypothetical protein
MPMQSLIIMNSLSLILGAVYFAFQIYGDFSGYSDMALGCLNYLELICSKILLPLFFQEILPSFGVVGIFRCPHGLEIIYISARR